MTNSTADYWDIDAVSLQTLAFGIDQWGVSEAPPGSRGSDLIVPNRIGQVARSRVPDGRVITFPMWCLDLTEAGAEGNAAQHKTNWEKLRDTFWNSGRPVVITKRWGGGASSAAAVGVFSSGLDPTIIGGDQGASRFTVDMFLADPYFYGASDNDTFSIGSTDPTWSGDAATPSYTVRFTGPLTNPSVTCRSFITDLSILTWTGVIGAGEYVDIVLPDLTFTTTVSGATVDQFTATEHQWAAVDPDVDAVIVAADAGSGTCKITYTPAFI